MTFEEWYDAHYPDDAAILKMHEEGSPLMAVEVIGARIAKRDRSKAYDAGRESMRQECVAVCSDKRGTAACIDAIKELP